MVDYCEKRHYNEAAAALRKEGRLVSDVKAPIESKEGLLYEYGLLPTLLHGHSLTTLTGGGYAFGTFIRLEYIPTNLITHQQTSTPKCVPPTCCI
jgi:hypothetical protein